jgi:hypothetical protein
MKKAEGRNEGRGKKRPDGEEEGKRRGCEASSRGGQLLGSD